MNCTRPTIVNIYKILGLDKQLVRYNYYREYYDIEGLKKKIGTIEDIKPTDKEKELYNLQPIYYPAKVTGSYIIPCGKCASCLKTEKHNKANRIYIDYLRCLEIDPTIKGHFLTITYDNDHLPKNQNLNKLSLENIIKNLKKLDPQLKYYAVGEYGGKTLRPHYHIIIWNEHINWGHLTLIKMGKKWNNYKIDNPTKIWNKGEITVAPIAPENISYVVGYSTKKLNRTKEEKKELETQKIQPEFNLQTRNIGHNYYEAHLQEIEDHKGKIYEHGRKITTDRSFKKYLEKNQYPIPEYITNQSHIINMEYTIKDNLITKEKTQTKLNKEVRKL